MMRGKVGKHSRRKFESAAQTPIKPKKMNVRDRVSVERPLLIPQSLIRNAIDIKGVLCALETRWMKRGRDEGHPRDRLRFGFGIVRRQQPCCRIFPSEILENARHLGERAPIN